MNHAIDEERRRSEPISRRRARWAFTSLASWIFPFLLFLVLVDEPSLLDGLSGIFAFPPFHSRLPVRAAFVAQLAGVVLYVVAMITALVLAGVALIKERTHRGPRRVLGATAGCALLLWFGSAYALDPGPIFELVKWTAALLTSGIIVVASIGILDPNNRWAPKSALLLSGILMFIIAPRFTAGHQIQRHKRTMAAFHTYGQLLDQYGDQYRRYPEATTIDGLIAALRCCYDGTLPRLDAWGRPLIVRSTATTYRLTSTSADGRLDPPGSSDEYFADMDRDIVYANGVFVSSLEGIPRQ